MSKAPPPATGFKNEAIATLTTPGAPMAAAASALPAAAAAALPAAAAVPAAAALSPEARKERDDRLAPLVPSAPDKTPPAAQPASIAQVPAGVPTTKRSKGAGMVWTVLAILVLAGLYWWMR